MKLQFELSEELGKKSLAWHEHHCGVVSLLWLHGTQSWGGGLEFLEYELIILATIVIILIVFFCPVVIIVTASGGLADVGVLAHSICAGHKIVHTMGAHEAQVVMHCSQMVYHSPFILPLPSHTRGRRIGHFTFIGPWGEWIPFSPIIFCDSVGTTTLKKWLSIWEALLALLAALSSCWLDQSSHTSWILMPRGFVEVANCQKVEERSYDPSCSKLGQWVL